MDRSAARIFGAGFPPAWYAISVGLFGLVLGVLLGLIVRPAEARSCAGRRGILTHI